MTFRTRSRDEIRLLNLEMSRDMLAHLDSIHVPVAARFGFGEALAATQYLAEPSHLGKVLLLP